MVRQPAARCISKFVHRSTAHTILRAPFISHKHQVILSSSQSRVLTPCSASSFHTYTQLRASGVSADEIMENLNDLYATAKDEFEIAAEGTEEKTVYAAEDREAAKEALTLLKEAYDKAVSESNPDVAKEVSSRVGQRIRELENAVTAMEERAMED